jgi:hypothetical protein
MYKNILTDLFSASSTDVERAFSRGGLTVSKMRHSLSDQSVRAATVLGSWSESPELIPSTQLTAAFNEKSKRPKGNNQKAGQVDAPEVTLIE